MLLTSVIVFLVVCADYIESDYSGCYPVDRSANINPGDFSPANLTNKRCLDICDHADYSYAGTTLGELCVCSNFLDSTHLHNDAHCTYPCRGDGESVCGGETFVSFYTVNTIRGLTFSVPELVQIFAVTYITPSVTRGDGVRYYANFGDDTGITDVTSSVITYHVRQLGKSLIVLTAIDSTGDSVTASQEIYAEIRVSDVTIVCPSFGVPNIQLRCQIIIKHGTNMGLVVDFGDKNAVAIDIANAELHKLGSIVGNAFSSPHDPNLLYIQPNNMAHYNGSLVALEYSAVSIGVLIIQVYRPTCSPGKIFCHRSYTCIPTTQLCSTQSDFWVKTCNSNAKFSFSNRLCVADPDQISTSSITDWESLGVPQYELVHEISINVSEAQKRFLPLSAEQQFALRQGDMMAVVDSGMLEVLEITSEHHEFAFDVSTLQQWPNRHVAGLKISSKGVALAARHALGFYMSRPSVTLIEHTYATSEHIFLVTANVTNSFGVISNTTRIDVQTKLRNVTFTGKTIGMVGYAMEYVIPPHIGSKYMYRWYVSDGFDNITSDPYLRHVFLDMATYNVTLVAYNDVSRMSYQTLVRIVYEIRNLTVSTSALATELMHPTVVKWSIEQGSNVSYVIDMGDGTTYSVEHDGFTNHHTIVQTEKTGELEHTYVDVGNYMITIVARNIASNDSALIYHPVQIKITFFQIIPSRPLTYGTIEFINMQMQNGTDVTLSAKLGDVNIATMMIDDVTKKGYAKIAADEYPGAGEFMFEVTYANLVSPAKTSSMRVSVYHPIANVTFNVNILFAKVGEAIRFNVTMLRCTRLHAKIDYGDNGLFNLDRQYLSLDEAVSISETHTFTSPNNYTVTLELENKVSREVRTLNVVVQYEILNIIPTMTELLPRYQHQNADASLTITFKGLVNAPTDASYVITYGDGSDPVEKYLNMTGVNPQTIVEMHPYTMNGTYSVSINISNLVSYLYKNFTVVIEEPIRDLTLRAVPPNVAVGEVSDLIMYMSWGSRVVCHWLFMDSSPPHVQSCPPLTNVTVSHKYEVEGVYPTLIRCVNAISAEVAFLPSNVIHVEYPVTGMDLITNLVNNSDIIGNNNNYSLTVTFNLIIDAVTPLPTSATYVINFADGIVLPQTSLPINYKMLNFTSGKNLVLSLPHTYTKGGRYTIKIRIKNVITDITYSVTIDLYEGIRVLRIEAYSSVNATHLNPGLGPKNDHFALEYPILLRSVVNKGSHITYTWNLGRRENDVQVVYENNERIVTYAEVKAYTIHVQAKSKIDASNYSITIFMQRGIYEANISCFQPKPKDTEFSFSIFLGSKASDACYFVDFVDPLSENNRYALFGDEAQCKESYPLLMADPKRRFNAMTTSDIGKQSNLSITNIYRTAGLFLTTLVISNKVTSVTAVWETGVTNGICWYATVNVQNLNQCQTPGCIAKEFMRMKTITIRSEVTINCESTNTAFYSWHVFRVDETTLEDIASVDLSDHVNLQSSAARTLVLQPLILNYGLYRFVLNVSMDEAIPLTSLDSVFIRVARSPLSAGIVGGDFVIRKWGDNITMDGFTLSGDPDVSGGGQDGLSFWWMCRRLCEEYPLYDPTFENITQPMTTKCTYSPQYINDTGCWVDDGVNSSGIIAGARTGFLLLRTGSMYESDTIEIMLIVKKGDHTANATQAILITPGDPPTVDLKCITNCGGRMNAVARFSLKTSVLGHTTEDSYEYEWVLSGVPPGATKYDKVIVDAGQWEYKATTGLFSANIALDAHLFSRNSPFKIYFLSVKVWRMTSNGVRPPFYGMVNKAFQINDEPVAGSCVVVPSVGVALETRFNVQCLEAFADNDQPISFRVGYKTKENMPINWLFNGPFVNTTSGFPLPKGLDTRNFFVDVIIRAVDYVGSFTDVVTHVQVSPAANNRSLIDDSFNTIVNLFVAADSQASQFVSIVFSDMNDEATADQLAATNEAEPQRRETTERAKNRTKFRENIISGFKKLEVTDLNMMSELLPGLQAATCEKKELTSSAMVDGLTLMENFASKVNTDSLIDPQTDQSPSANEIEETTTGLYSIIAPNSTWQFLLLNGSSIFTYIKGNIIRGENASELATDALVETTNRTTTTSAPSNASLTSKNIDSSSFARKMFHKMEAVIDKLSKTVGTRKVAGESHSMLEGGSLNVTLAKDFASDISKRIKSSSGSAFLLPAETFLFGQKNLSGQVMNIQLTTMSSSPYTWATLSAATKSVSGDVVTLTIRNASHGVVSVTNTDQPFDIFINRQQSSKGPTIVRSATTPAGKDMVVHVITVPAYNSLHVKLEMVKSNVSADDDFTSDNSTAFDSSTLESPTTEIHDDSTTTNKPYSDTTEHITYSTPGTNNSIVTNGSLLSNFSEALSPIFGNISEAIEFKVYAKKGSPPKEDDYDLLCTLPLSSDDIISILAQLDSGGQNRSKHTNRQPDPNTCFFPSTQVDEEVKYFIGVKHSVKEVITPQNATVITQSRTGLSRETVAYDMGLYTTFCVYWDDSRAEWLTHGCQTGPLTTVNVTHCRCNHLTTFTSGFTVPMNTINLDDSAFLKLDENPVIFATMLAIICAYLVLLIWARKKDQIDLLKAGVTPLPDNDPRHRILYEIKILTGSRKDSGTTSKVSLILAGDADETHPRLLVDEKRPVLQTAGCDTFIMAVPKRLGNLSHLRIWHDNSGSNPSWYFSRMVVTDLQTDDKSYFIANRWLAVAEEDGQIDIILPVAGKDELTSFNTLFWSNTKKNLYDGHLWFSVLNRPPSSSFTRVQRLTCCLCLLFCSMLASIAWYKTNENSSSQVFRFGPITFSLTGIYVGFISSMMAFPASLIVVCLFRYARPTPLKKRGFKVAPEEPSQIPLPKPILREADENNWDTISIISSTLSFDTLTTDEGSETDFNRIWHNPVAPSYPATLPPDTVLNTPRVQTSTKKKKPFMLPHFCVYFGYMMAFACIAVSFWATIEFGGVFGRKKSEEWLIAFCVSIVESVFFSQPLKVILLAVFYALLCKKPDTEEETNPQLAPDEEWLHDHLSPQDMKHSDNVKMLERLRDAVPQPLNQDYLKSAREERMKEKQMWTIIRDITLYLIFMCLLMLVGYGNRHPWSHTTLHHYRNLFLNQKYNLEGRWPPSASFKTIKSSKEFFFWMENILLPTIYVKVQAGPYVRDEKSILLGVVRLRQVRMPRVACPKEEQFLVATCVDDYDIWQQDEKNYAAKWMSTDTNVSGDPQFKYRPWESLGSLPYWGRFALYSGGGYVADLGKDYQKAASVVARIKRQRWLDEQTRAVFVEFVLFNVNSHLWSVSLMLVEFEAHGGATPNFRFHVMGLDRYTGSFMVVLIVSEVLTFVFIIVFTVKQVIAIRTHKCDYFKVILLTMYITDVWNWLEMLILGLSYSAIVMLLYRIFIAYETREKIKIDKTKFISFHYAIIWDEVYGYLVGFIVFGSTLKLTRLLRFNKKLSFLGSTLKYVAQPIMSFAPAVIIVFVGFASLGYLSFGRTTKRFSSFMATCGSLLQMILTAFERRNFNAVMQSVGSMFFAAFTLLMNYIVINLFITILIDGFNVVRENLAKQSNDYEIVDFMVDKLKVWFRSTIISRQVSEVGQARSRAQPAVYVEGESEEEALYCGLERKIDEMVGKLGIILDIDMQPDLEEIEKRRLKNRTVYLY